MAIPHDHRLYTPYFRNATLARITRSIEYIEERGEEKIVGKVPTTFRDDVRWLNDHLIKMKLNMSAKSAQRLLNYVIDNNDEISSDKLRPLADKVSERVIDELEDRFVLWVHSDRAVYYEMANTILGKDIIRKFPPLIGDAAEAGNCFALGRYTACVFHLMRIMERVVQQFGRKVRVPLAVENETWDKIAKQIKKLTEPDSKDDSKQKKKKKRYQSFYNRLDAVRVAWRNSTMHPKATYTEEEAKEVMDAVRLFVKDFSKLR